MPNRSTFLAVLAAVAALGFAGLSAPEAARADRCNPEELAGQEPILFGEDQGPFCDLMLNVVYPRLGCDATTMQRCLETVDPFVVLGRDGDTCVPTSFISEHCVARDTPTVIMYALGCTQSSTTRECINEVIGRAR